MGDNFCLNWFGYLDHSIAADRKDSWSELGTMMLEDGYVERLDEHNFVRYLVFKIQISDLERRDLPNEPDTFEYTAKSTKLIVKFVEYAVALYNYLHGTELTF